MPLSRQHFTYFTLWEPRFFDPGSTVVSVLPSDEDDGDRRLQYTAAERPDGAVALVVLNRYVIRHTKTIF